jgi:primosomal protein N' (replication factor Y)
MAAPPVLRVALDVPLPRLFDYRAPQAPPPVDLERLIGARVLVPFGKQRLIGIIVAGAARSEIPGERLKSIAEVLDERPVLDPASLELLRWAADYYHCPIGEVLLSALPQAIKHGSPADARQRRWSATAEGEQAYGRGDLRRAPKRKQLLGYLVAHGEATADLLAEHIPSWREAARALEHRGWIASRQVLASPPGDSSFALRAMGPRLREEQQAAVSAVSAALGKFGAFLLHGVTGSGKTEVYLRLVERVLGEGQRALVLVPEIGLTPQLIARFKDRFATPMAVLHSALTDHERLSAWRAAFSGHARVVLGTRSAVFAPLRDPGIIIVDEEHDASYKEHEASFRYSARDVAIVRAQRLNVPIVLGSATPALETLHNVAQGRYTRLSLKDRAGQAQAPRMSVVDLRTSAVSAGLATPSVQAIERHLKEDGQVLVYLNRRGYAPTLLCTACGWLAPCSDCDARLTVHLTAQQLRCHHCGAEAPLPARCPKCGFKVKPVGQGTERIAEALAARFPGVPIARLDRDVVRRRGDAEAVLRRMASGEARILVGTQMVTKGHDFPNVTLVLALNADQGLFSSDFRAPERLAQTLIQVAGRAGRGTRPGEVLIQTELPTHPLLRSLLTAGYEGFAEAALAERAQTAWPPFSRLAAVRDSALTKEAAQAFLTDAKSLGSPPPAGLRILGPVPAAMAKRAGRYHAQLLIESVDRPRLHAFLKGWLQQVRELKSARQVRWALDVDPLELF